MQYRFTTPSGLSVECRRTILPYASALEGFAARLDRDRGALLSSGVDYPGRYSRWEFGCPNPPLEIFGRGRALVWPALNPRGRATLRFRGPSWAAAGIRRAMSDGEASHPLSRLQRRAAALPNPYPTTQARTTPRWSTGRASACASAISSRWC